MANMNGIEKRTPEVVNNPKKLDNKTESALGHFSAGTSILAKKTAEFSSNATQKVVSGAAWTAEGISDAIKYGVDTTKNGLISAKETTAELLDKTRNAITRRRVGGVVLTLIIAGTVYAGYKWWNSGHHFTFTNDDKQNEAPKTPTPDAICQETTGNRESFNAPGVDHANGDFNHGGKEFHKNDDPKALTNEWLSKTIDRDSINLLLVTEEINHAFIIQNNPDPTDLAIASHLHNATPESLVHDGCATPLGIEAKKYLNDIMNDPKRSKISLVKIANIDTRNLKSLWIWNKQNGTYELAKPTKSGFSGNNSEYAVKIEILDPATGKVIETMYIDPNCLNLTIEDNQKTTAVEEDKDHHHNNKCTHDCTPPLDSKVPAQNPSNKGNAHKGGGNNNQQGPGQFTTPSQVTQPSTTALTTPLAPKTTTTPTSSTPNTTPAPKPEVTATNTPNTPVTGKVTAPGK